MRITVYGTRGSYPVCRRDAVRYGGNTTCLFVEEGDTWIVVDAGTGIRNLGNYLHQNDLCRGRHLTMAITHTHWDHIMGLPFFAPLYIDGFTATLYGADSETMRLHEIVTRQLDGRYNFPVLFEQLSAHVAFQSLRPGDGIHLDRVRIRTYQLNHPGTDLGYRIETPSGTFVFLTDVAPIEGNHLGLGMKEAAADRRAAFEQDYYAGLVEFVRGADLVMHDTNFTPEEIVGRRHWGHSTPDDALKLVSSLDNPPAVVLSHHDPNRSDAELDAIYDATRRRGRAEGIEVLIAREGGDFIL
jgi:phosphoribosyl 1,2-cyclic phosphodiesterase